MTDDNSAAIHRITAGFGRRQQYILVFFEIIGVIVDLEVIASGRSIREL